MSNVERDPDEKVCTPGRHAPARFTEGLSDGVEPAPGEDGCVVEILTDASPMGAASTPHSSRGPPLHLALALLFPFYAILSLLHLHLRCENRQYG